MNTTRPGKMQPFEACPASPDQPGCQAALGDVPTPLSPGPPSLKALPLGQLCCGCWEDALCGSPIPRSPGKSVLLLSRTPGSLPRPSSPPRSLPGQALYSVPYSRPCGRDVHDVGSEAAACLGHSPALPLTRCVSVGKRVFLSVLQPPCAEKVADRSTQTQLSVKWVQHAKSQK